MILPRAKPLSEINDIMHVSKHQKLTSLSSLLVRTVLPISEKKDVNLASIKLGQIYQSYHLAENYLFAQINE